MTDIAPFPRSAVVHLKVSFWWSRFDDLANLELANIFARHGHPVADAESATDIDASLRMAVQNEAALDELAQWVEMISERRGSSVQNPEHSLDSNIDYLVGRLDESPLSGPTLHEIRQQIKLLDGILRDGQDCPEMAHPDAAMTARLTRYREIRERILAARPAE